MKWIFFIVSDPSGVPDSDNWGNPVGALYSGDATGISSTTPTTFDVALSGSATLTAGTTYWLMAKVPGPNPCGPCFNQAVNWYENFSSTKPAGYDTILGETGRNAVGNPTMAFTLDNNATASTPEPSTLMLFSLVARLYCCRGLRENPSEDSPGGVFRRLVRQSPKTQRIPQSHQPAQGIRVHGERAGGLIMISIARLPGADDADNTVPAHRCRNHGLRPEPHAR